tara:strand:- start:302 stop:928 length:627 start_codon:yes stop_codon:yes gene_type:complete
MISPIPTLLALIALASICFALAFTLGSDLLQLDKPVGLIATEEVTGEQDAPTTNLVGAPPVQDAERISVDTIPPYVAPQTPIVDPCAELERQVRTLRLRVAYLELELITSGSQETRGTLADWFRVLLPDERPTARELHLMAGWLKDFGSPALTLSAAEGLWILDHVRAKNFDASGLIDLLGEQRIADGVTPEALADLRRDWADEGRFR